MSLCLELDTATVKASQQSNRLASTDPAFFEQIFCEHEAKLLQKAQRMLGSREAAEDLVQEVFANTYRLVAAGKEICADSIGGWLYVCTYHQALSALRRRKRGAQVKLEPEDCRLVDPAPEVTERIILQDRSQAVLDAVAMLPQRQSLALLLHDLKGFNYEETADQLGVSSSVVCQLLFRARRKIRSDLGREATAAPPLA